MEHVQHENWPLRQKESLSEPIGPLGRFACGAFGATIVAISSVQHENRAQELSFTTPYCENMLVTIISQAKAAASLR